MIVDIKEEKKQEEIFKYQQQKKGLM